jgi:hypothetical protein
LLAKVVAPGVSDLGVDRAHAAGVVGAARLGERRLVSAVVLERWHDPAVAAGGESLQAEIDADLAGTRRSIGRNLALQGDIPAATRILHEAAGLDLAADVARRPQLVPALEVGDVGAVYLHGAEDKGHPSQALLSGAPARAAAEEATAGGELPADGLHAIGVQAELGAAPRARMRPVAPLQGQ